MITAAPTLLLDLDHRLREKAKRAGAIEREPADPIDWVESQLGARPWTMQRQILASVRDHPITAVASCHGAGKSWLAARASIWFLNNFRDSLVVTTAPTGRQVRNVLWREIRSAVRGAAVTLPGRLMQTEYRITDEWYALGFSTDDPDKFQGLHAPHMLVVVDEAGGMEPSIWTGIDGVLSSAHVRLLAIGNPTESSGYFYDLFRRLPDEAKFHISAYDTPNLSGNGEPIPGLVSREWVEDKERRWRGTPLFASRVLGDFPDASADTLFPLSWVERAVARELEPGTPAILGCDIARFGDDESIIVLRRGPVARLFRTERHADTMTTAGWIRRARLDTGATAEHVDAVGLGAGTFDRLIEQHEPAVEMEAGGRSHDADRFLNLRAEWYWTLRERFQDGDIDIEDDHELTQQLTAMRYSVNSKGQIQIESKDDIKARGLPSPDRADALALAYGTPRRALSGAYPVITPQPTREYGRAGGQRQYGRAAR